MTDYEPRSADTIAGDATPPTTALPWEEARQRLAEARTYWLATTHTDGRPHVRPVLAVWVDGVLHSTTNPSAQKARNLTASPRCSVSVISDGIDLVLEGEARFLAVASRVARVADEYASKYGWRVTVHDGVFDAEYGAPTAGPPPYTPFEIVPRTVYAFGTDETFAPRSTRFRFEFPEL